MVSLYGTHFSPSKCLLFKLSLCALFSYNLSEALVYTWPLPNGFNEGDMVTIKGSVPIDGSAFSVNFMTGSNISSSDVIFHMGVRYGVDQIVFNSRNSGIWMNQDTYEKAGAIQAARRFTIFITLKCDQYMITTNGRHFVTFKVRRPTSFIQFLMIYDDSHVYLWPLLNAFNDGDLVTIQGRLPSNGSRFDINFHEDKDLEAGDIYFHMSNRYGYDQIVLNTREQRVGWLTEEIYNGTGALTPGTFCSITIALSKNQFTVAINGYHFANFKVRRPTSLIRYLSVVSEIELSSIILSQSTPKGSSN